MNNNQIGKFLKKLRIQNNLTQKDLADILVITPQTISKWELSTSLPNLDMLVSLSKIYKISVDEIIQCNVKEEEENNRISIEHIIVLIMYLVMLGFAITIPFINFTTSVAGFDSYVKLNNWLLMMILLILPILLSVTFVIDKKKTSNIIISMFAAISLISFTLSLMSSPSFISAEPGMVLLLLYILLLILSSVLIVIPIENPIFNYRLLKQENIIVISLLFIVTLPLPFFYYSLNSNYTEYYFGELDKVIYLFCLLLPVLILLKYTEIIPKKNINRISIAFSFFLILTTLVYIFNSSLLIPPIFIYVYIIILGYDLREPFSTIKTKVKAVFPLNILFVDIVSMIVYIYLFNNPGDLLSRNEPWPDNSPGIYFLNDLGFGPFIYLHIILLLMAIALRVAKLKEYSKIMYSAWGLWLLIFTTIFCIKYVFNIHYQMSDGILFLVPPILLIIFLASHLPNYLNNKKTKTTLNTKIRI